MSTSTEAYVRVSDQARGVAESTVNAWKQGTETLAGQADVFESQVPQVDVAGPVGQYFDLVQRSVEFNREFALRWAGLVGELSDTIRELGGALRSLVTEQVEKAAELAVEAARKADEAARAQAVQAEEEQKEQDRAARRAEREHARKANAKARAKYEDLGKAELSDRLAHRELPKTGTVEELIERLVEADQK